MIWLLAPCDIVYLLVYISPTNRFEMVQFDAYWCDVYNVVDVSLPGWLYIH